MTPDEARELIGAFVLGACTPEEAAEVRAHMVASPTFRAEVASFDPVRDALLDVPVPEERPGADLKRRLMAQVQEEASLFGAAGTPGAGRGDTATAVREDDEREAGSYPPAPSVSVTDAAPATASSPVEAPRGSGAPAHGDGAGPRRSGFLAALRHPARATALAAVVVALVVAGVLFTGGEATERVPGQVLGAAAPGASVAMVSSGDEHRLEVRGLKPAGSGRAYQVWLKTGDEAPKPTTVLFDVDDRGRAEATIDGDMSGVDDVLVTAEPEGGSPAPTSDPVIRVPV
ncbi:anti-sigma factor domain-containing protein [Patulibacter americanus]|uniref:anti-sigma factor domain-containing protein n=1 Tax=Patulibacter americanus TaxID=588672 RepID=UPI0003B4F6F6|nr:anti-sigma factor [Patulibacter americanus]